MNLPENSPHPEGLDSRWSAFEKQFERKFQKKPTLETALFIIGVENRFKGSQTDKSDKERFIAEGFHIAFESEGYYERQSDGSWKELKPLPQLGGAAKEAFFREAILRYFAQGENSDKSP